MKRKILFFVEIVISIILFAACLKRPVTVFEGRNDVFTEKKETGYDTGGNFKLLPGVYRICVQTEGEDGTWDGMGIEIGLGADESTYHAIRGNEGSVPAGQEKEILYYVTGNVKEAHVMVKPLAEGKTVAYSVRVERTAAGYRMLLAMTVAGFLLFDFLWLFHDRIKAGDMTPQKKWVFAGIVGTIFLAGIPLTADWLILGTDSLQCLTETEYVLRGELGQVPAVHLCYLWLPALLRLIGFPVMTAYKGLRLGEILFAVLIFYEALSRTWKKESWYLPGILFGVVNPLAVKLLYVESVAGWFLLYVLAAAVLLAVLGKACRLSERTLSSWVVFAAVLVLVLQAVYFENRLTFQSEPLYWYNEEPFLTGETQL